MAGVEQGQFRMYAAEAAIPRYQRAWVWGTTALAILLCGAVAGWLLSGITPFNALSAGAALTEQEQLNARLRERIAQLEQALGGDPCTLQALEALRQDAQR